MAAGGPWSVKGIDPRARETAREAARREGKTLGEWLNAIILEGDEPSSAGDIPGAARYDEPYHGRHGGYEDERAGLDYGEDLAGRLKTLSKRLEAAEHRSTLAITGMDQSILGLIARLERTEQTAKDSAGRVEDGMDELRGAHQTLAARLKQLEQDDTAEELKSLEDAVATVAGHVHQKDQRTQTHFQAVEERLEKLAGKLEKATDDLTRRVDAASDHAEMKARRETESVRQELETFRENGQQALADLKDSVDRINERLGSAEKLTDNAVRALEASFANLDDRLKKAEETAQAGGGDLDERFAALSGELKSMIEASRAETAKSLAEAASDTRLDRLQKSLEESDRRHAETLAQIGDKIGQLGDAVEKRMRQTERRLSDEALQDRNMEARLREVETQSAAAVRRVSEEVEDVSSKLGARIAASEDRNAAAVASLSDQIESLREQRSRDDDEALERRLRDSEERTQQMIREAVAGVGAKIDAVRDENETALSPVQSAMADLARRLEAIEARRDAGMPDAGHALAAGAAAAAIPEDEPFFVDELDDETGADADYEEEVALDAPQAGRRNPFGAVYDLDEDEDDAAAAAAGGDAPESDPFSASPPGGAPPDSGDSSSSAEPPEAEEAAAAAAESAGPDPDHEAEREAEAAFAAMLAESDAGSGGGAADDDGWGDEEAGFGAAPGDEAGHPGRRETAIAGTAPGAGSAGAQDEPGDTVAEARAASGSKRAAGADEADAQDDSEELIFAAPELTEAGPELDAESGAGPEPETVARPEEAKAPAPLGATADLGFLTAARNAARNAPEDARRGPSSTILDSKQQRGGNSAARKILVATGALATLTLAGAAGLLLLDTRPSGSSPRVAGPIDGSTMRQPAGQAPEETRIAETAPVEEFDAGLEEPADAPAPSAQAPEDAAATGPGGADGGAPDEAAPEGAETAAGETAPAPASDAAAEPGDPAAAAEPAGGAPETQLAESAPSAAPDPAASVPDAEITQGVPGGGAGGPDATDVALASLAPSYQFQLGLAELQAEDYEDGVRLVRSAAEAGYAPAQYRLGKLYESGTGVGEDLAAARQWTERAANAGNRKAMHNLGVMYAEGRGAEQDMQTAAKWFEQAALHGAADSQFNLGILYEQGRGLPRSLPDAYAWYRIAARGGDQEAAARAEQIAAELPEEAVQQARQVAENFTPRPLDPQSNGVNDEETGALALSGPAAVARAQALLTELGYEAGAPDGDLGAETRMAIIQYQRDNGLVQSGEVSPRLLERLEVASARE